MSGASFAGLRRNVSPLELFFGLVFVFSVDQLAHHLHDKLSGRGAAETAVMLVAVLSTWALTSFDATFLDVQQPRTRRLVLVVMGLGLFMNAQSLTASGGPTTPVWHTGSPSPPMSCSRWAPAPGRRTGSRPMR
ncbi:low temperature requirement protein A [Streptomyces sp. TRM S81-3]|uniref:Low temperature requirement protein A n=1 Tax=Streptomyces griseicoloratus TaxID=2752516 RepID=A0A926L8W8_9ACTN|nr:low temperature requirement protein A [Streptomyces griseicoloratus]MBD0422238.1 low temperature requirement protein A [Streptomyces griseicoloratus]